MEEREVTVGELTIEMTESAEIEREVKKLENAGTDVDKTTRTFEYHDTIIEDDPVETNAPSVLHPKPVKRGVIMARRSSELVTKRPASTPLLMTSDAAEVKVTRRSVSRQGSRIQQGSRMQIIDEDIDISTRIVLKSVTQNESNIRKWNELSEISEKQLMHHHQKATSAHPLKSRAFYATLEIAKATNLVLVTGKAGGGKTYTALDIMCELTDTNPGYKPVLVSSPFHLDAMDDTPVQSVVLIDDCFGSRTVNKANVNYFVHSIKKLKSLVRMKKLILVLTSDNDVLQLVQNDSSNANFLSLLHIDTVRLDLNSDAFQLTRQEREDILTEYINNEAEVFQEIVQLNIDDCVVGFQLLCHLCRATSVNKFFEDPFQSIVEEIERMKDDKDEGRVFAQYILLLLVLLMDGRFPSTGLNSADKKYFIRLMELYTPLKCSYSEVQSHIPIMIARHFLVEDENKYVRISHKIVSQALTKVFITHSAVAAVLELLPIDALNEVFFYPEDGEDTPHDTDIAQVVKGITKDESQMLAKRFRLVLNAKKPCSFRAVADSQLWEQSAYFDVVLETCGLHFFFMPDEAGTPFSVYLVQASQDVIISKVGRCFPKTRDDVLVDLRPLIAITAAKAIKYKMKKGLSRFLKVCNAADIIVPKAAVRSGEIRFVEDVLNPVFSMYPSLGDLIQIACICGDVTMVKYLFSKVDKDVVNALRNRKNQDGIMMVHFAAMGGEYELLEFLQKHSFNLQSQTHDGSTILDISSIHGRSALAKKVTEHFPDMPEMTNNFGFTCAHFAAREGHVDTFKLLTALGADPTLKIHGGNSVFHLAAINGNIAVLRELLKNYKSMQGLPNDDSFTPQQLAAKFGQLDALIFFLTNGISSHELTVDGRTFLHLAAFNGHLDIVKYLCLKYPTIAQIVDNDGNTAAHDAAAGGNLDVLIFLEGYISAYTVSHDGCTLMHEACYYGRLNIVQFICNNCHGFENMATKNGYTPCHAAALGGFVDILDFLIKSGADPLVQAEDGSTILHEATYAGKHATVKYILSFQPDMVQVLNKRSYVACHFAAQEGHSEILSSLTTAMNGEVITTKENQTYLHIAAFNGRMDIVKSLCQKYPDMITQMDINGAQPIHYSARGGHVNLLDFLLTQSTDPMSTTENGSTLLHLAAYDGQLGMITHLCDRYPQLIPLSDKLGHTAIHYGAGCGNLQVLSLLLNKGMDPIARTTNGSTILLKAVYSGEQTVIEHICNTFPELLSVSDEFGCTALHYAATSGHLDTLKYLIDKCDLDPASQTNDGHSLVHVAAYHGRKEMVVYLCETYPEILTIVDTSGRTPEQFARLGDHGSIIRYLKGINKQVKRSEGSSKSLLTSFWDRCHSVACFCRRVNNNPGYVSN